MEEADGFVVLASEYNHYFANIRDNNFLVSIYDSSFTIGGEISIMRPDVSTFITDDIKDELIPILVTLKQVYKVDISILSNTLNDDNSPYRGRINYNLNKFLNDKVSVDNVVCFYIYLSEKKESAFEKVLNYFKKWYT